MALFMLNNLHIAVIIHLWTTFTVCNCLSLLLWDYMLNRRNTLGPTQMYQVQYYDFRLLHTSYTIFHNVISTIKTAPKPITLPSKRWIHQFRIWD